MPLPGTRSAEYQRLLRRLKEARRQAGLTQAEVARRLHKSQAFVSKSESGDRRLDPIELQAFAQLYRKPITFFFKR